MPIPPPYSAASGAHGGCPATWLVGASMAAAAGPGVESARAVIRVVRRSCGAGVVAEVLDAHRTAPWVSNLHAAHQGHAVVWHVPLVRRLRDRQYAMDAGGAAFARDEGATAAPDVLVRRHRDLAKEREAPPAAVNCKHQQVNRAAASTSLPRGGAAETAHQSACRA